MRVCVWEEGVEGEEGMYARANPPARMKFNPASLVKDNEEGYTSEALPCGVREC